MEGCYFLKDRGITVSQSVSQSCWACRSNEMENKGLVLRFSAQRERKVKPSHLTFNSTQLPFSLTSWARISRPFCSNLTELNAKNGMFRTVFTSELRNRVRYIYLESLGRDKRAAFSPVLVLRSCSRKESEPNLSISRSSFTRINHPTDRPANNPPR